MNNYQCYVYCLFRPHEGQPFYFGVTEMPVEREGAHKRKHGKDIYFALLHAFPNSMHARQCESQYIRRYALQGVPLLNMASNPKHPRVRPDKLFRPDYSI